ncbi:MAG TPA: hypothetical protein VK752_15490 [Bryobacteraceae bacterium]|nr:hypothetical protein [Bryobacteraceae bacterium]
MSRDLKPYAYMWSRDGSAEAMSGPATGYKVDLGETKIQINNSSTPDRPDWYYRIEDKNGEVCCNQHFATEYEALESAEKCKRGTRPSLRHFRLTGDGYEAYTVDGLTSDVEVTISELNPNDWRFRVSKEGLYGQWTSSCPTKEDALASYLRFAD